MEELKGELSELPELYVRALRNVSGEFEPDLERLGSWTYVAHEDAASLEDQLNVRVSATREVLNLREQRLVSIFRAMLPAVLDAPDLPEKTKNTIVDLQGTFKNYSKHEMDHFLAVTEKNIKSDEEKAAIRIGFDGAVLAYALRRCQALNNLNPATAANNFLHSNTYSSSLVSNKAIRQVLESEVFTRLSSRYAWIDLETNRLLIDKFASDDIAKKVMKIPQIRNILLGALRYSKTPEKDIEEYCYDKTQKKILMTELELRQPAAV